jgi:hypothetical protein
MTSSADRSNLDPFTTQLVIRLTHHRFKGQLITTAMAANPLGSVIEGPYPWAIAL